MSLVAYLGIGSGRTKEDEEIWRKRRSLCVYVFFFWLTDTSETWHHPCYKHRVSFVRTCCLRLWKLLEDGHVQEETGSQRYVVKNLERTTTVGFQIGTWRTGNQWLGRLLFLRLCCCWWEYVVHVNRGTAGKQAGDVCCYKRWILEEGFFFNSMCNAKLCWSATTEIAGRWFVSLTGIEREVGSLQLEVRIIETLFKT